MCLLSCWKAFRQRSGKKLTRSLRIPTIGIGAGPDCDGQILVLDDVLGLSRSPRPKFVKAYAELRMAAY